MTINFLKRAYKMLLGASPNGVKLAPQVFENWELSPEFILDSKRMHSGEPVGRFAFNPDTKEMVIGTIGQSHAELIANQAISLFDDFVRGVYSNGKIMLRWYSSDPYATADEIKADSFDAWFRTKSMLERNGMPAGMPVEMGLSTEDIQNEVGRNYK